jgi:hypothetical protein
MSWQVVLTLLTALTMVARFSIPELILIAGARSPLAAESYVNA